MFIFSFSGRPKPTVRWLRGDQEVAAESEVSSGTTVTSTLMLVDLKRSDNEVVLTCEANNNNFSAPVYTSVTILMNRKTNNFFKPRWRSCPSHEKKVLRQLTD
jgi:hypothetical protein